MSDLTERLRTYAADEQGWTSGHKVMTEAADEIDRLTRELAEARDKALEEAATIVLRELSECGEAVNAIDAVDFPTETQQWNRHFYRGGYRASANIAASIRALKEKP